MSALGAIYRAVGKPLFFRLDPERAHELATIALRAMHRSPSLRRLVRRPLPESAAVEALGLRFASPVGMAAGFDKAARLYNGLGALGFGFVEVGTVTAHAQPGNDRPRLFRLPADRALVNRMGFNNPGAEAVARALDAHPPDGIVLGVNIGKSKVTPLEEAPADYAASARLLAPRADYLVVNVSSPNTPGLRALQAVEALGPILDAVQGELARLGRRVPLLVKIAPDLADDDVAAVAALAVERRLDGLVAANTTIGRAGLRTPAAEVERAGAGGLSGPPLHARMIALLRRLRACTNGRLALIAAGGIATADDARAALDAGASLVQLYTAFIYEGPDLPRKLAEGLSRRS